MLHKYNRSDFRHVHPCAFTYNTPRNLAQPAGQTWAHSQLSLYHFLQLRSSLNIPNNGKSFLVAFFSFITESDWNNNVPFPPKLGLICEILLYFMWMNKMWSKASSLYNMKAKVEKKPTLIGVGLISQTDIFPLGILKPAFTLRTTSSGSCTRNKGHTQFAHNAVLVSNNQGLTLIFW